MTITTTTDLSGLYNTIYEDALFIAREANLMVGLVRNFSAVGYMARKITQRPSLSAMDKPEGVDFQNGQTFGKTLKATLTPKTIMAQTILTDEDVATDPDDARQDAAQELGGAVATKIDKDLLALFDEFTTDKGGAGAALTVAKCAAAISVMRANKAQNPIYFVLHPFGWHDIWLELGQPASQKAFLGDLANEAMKSFFVGSWLAATWFTSANIDIDADADAVSGVFYQNALGFDSRNEPTLEPQRDASLLGTELNMSAGYAVGKLHDEWGVGLTHDATEPV